jgi:hypothetical protein
MLKICAKNGYRLCKQITMNLHSCENPGLNNKMGISWSKWEIQDRIGVEIAEGFSHMRGLGTRFFLYINGSVENNRI